MTLASTDIALMSPYTVGTGKFTTAVYNYLVVKAKARLDREGGTGLSSDDYDQAHALLVCHMYSVKLGSAHKKSESLGDYSYTKDNTEGSNYLQEYKDMLKAVIGRTPSTAYEEERCDREMDDFDLDQSEIPKYPED
jgi:hypothetical protein